VLIYTHTYTHTRRLGGIGYLVTDALPGNQGFLDQRAALQWVASNIATFQGDPKQVTVWGESAGAGSAGLHVLSPGSNKLFQG
jgi:carboxylesterase type B